MSGRAHAIESRDHLINLLAEAAEIEHNLMCCYLYAAFSLKEGLDEDLTEKELASVQRWRREIIHVGIEEMTHLGLVANLMSALGGSPHFGRANFPIPAGYHPAGIVVKLAPFNYETLEHFIYLERPENSEVRDGIGFEPPQRYQRVGSLGRLMPISPDYDTVGALYHAIREGLERLAQRDGERALFIGDPAHQLGADVTSLPDLSRVRCLKTSLEALDGIVTQGEGAPGHSENSHYQRFLKIQRELEELRGARPAFVPARPAAHNPVMRRPPTPEGKLWIQLQPAADLVDLANAVYTLMLRLMAQAYAETRGTLAQRPLVDAATDLMYAITPVASALTRLPANVEQPECTAGMSFATVRAAAALPPGPLADKVLIERLREITTVAGERLKDLPSLVNVATRLERICNRLSKELSAMPAQDQDPKPAAADEPATRAVPASVITDGVESVEGAALTLRFEAKRCIHARHCVLGQPEVFKANVQGPWLDPDAASVEALVTVAHLCPSGAIQYTRKDGGANEGLPPVNLVQLRENGPLGMRGDLRIEGVSVGYRATLCRCGASQRKPFCDGSHATIGFVASGEPETKPSEPLATRDGPVDIRPQPDGPLVIRGNLELCAGTGRTLNRVTQAKLCRCGGSSNKPYCDGTHAKIGFQAD
jgi:CDGSH-type Zn-finger protein/uncharacterized Fe-S cluster protein YjdI